MASSTSRPSRPVAIPPRLPLPTFHRARSRPSWTLFVVLLVFLAGPVVAATTVQLAGPEETLAVDDRRPVKVNDVWHMVDADTELRLAIKRQIDDADLPETTLSPTSTESGSTEEDMNESDTAPSQSQSTSSAVYSPSPLPSPFDGNLDFNFTSNGGKSCPMYLNSLFASDNFKACYPLSMMLQTSTSFFDAMKTLQGIVTVLDATCASDLDSCTTYLRAEAENLISEANCGEDFRRSQPNIVQAYLGMRAFNVLYKATCLRNAEDPDGIYCFANAVTNSSTPANAYFYFLPLNMTLPGGSNPACTQCLQDTMAIFQAATSSRRQAISDTYVQAATQLNSICGPEFVDKELAPERAESGMGLAISPSWPTLLGTLLIGTLVAGLL